MAYNVKILPTAEQEVDDIVEYLMGHGINTARRFLAKYRQQLEILQSGVADYGLSFLRELRGLGYHVLRELLCHAVLLRRQRCRNCSRVSSKPGLCVACHRL